MNIKSGNIEKSKKNTYIFIKKIGEGTYGEVWLARINNTSNYVVIKIYKHEVIKSALSDFKRELKTLVYLSENIDCNKYAVCYLDHYILNQRPRLVMNYIQGTELRNMYIYDNKLAYDLIIGLYTLHYHGIAHQDIKATNIMYDKNSNRYKYIDWGTACIKSLLCNNDSLHLCKKTCGFIGTENYTSPEILNKIDMEYNIYIKTYFIDNVLHDIWSVGVLLLEKYGRYNVISDYIQYYDQEKINEIINNNVSNRLVRCILPFILEKRKYYRALYWKPIVKFLQDNINYL
jgi:serine/threonine protein kinase